MTVVADIRVRPGDNVKPGDVMFTLRLVSEIVQTSQSELFKNSREMQIVNEQLERLKASQGAVAGQLILDKEQQFRRLQAVAEALRQELATRGLTREQIDKVDAGEFVREITVVAPPPIKSQISMPSNGGSAPPFAYEMQELKV